MAKFDDKFGQTKVFSAWNKFLVGHHPLIAEIWRFSARKWQKNAYLNEKWTIFSVRTTKNGNKNP